MAASDTEAWLVALFVEQMPEGAAVVATPVDEFAAPSMWTVRVAKPNGDRRDIRVNAPALQRLTGDVLRAAVEELLAQAYDDQPRLPLRDDLVALARAATVQATVLTPVVLGVEEGAARIRDLAAAAKLALEAAALAPEPHADEQLGAGIIEVARAKLTERGITSVAALSPTGEFSHRLDALEDAEPDQVVAAVLDELDHAQRDFERQRAGVNVARTELERLRGMFAGQGNHHADGQVEKITSTLEAILEATGEDIPF